MLSLFAQCQLKAHLDKLLDQYEVSVVDIKKRLQGNIVLSFCFYILAQRLSQLEYRESIGEEAEPNSMSDVQGSTSQTFQAKVVDGVINMLN